MERFNLPKWLIVFVLMLFSTMSTAQKMNKKTTALFNQIIENYIWETPDFNMMDSVNMKEYYWIREKNYKQKNKIGLWEQNAKYAAKSFFLNNFEHYYFERNVWQKIVDKYPEISTLAHKQQNALYIKLKNRYNNEFESGYEKSVASGVEVGSQFLHRNPNYLAYLKEKRLEKQRLVQQRQKEEFINNIEVSTEQCVDLGLSVYWAGYNLGASSPEKRGGWYLWGETEPVYKQGIFTSKNFITDDQLNATKPSYTDVVPLMWGNGWKSPTKEQIQELIQRCSFYEAKYKGCHGLKVVGPSGKAIFIPAYGQVEYLSCSYKTYYSERARKEIIDIAAGACMRIIIEGTSTNSIELGGIYRKFSAQIRPIKLKK